MTRIAWFALGVATAVVVHAHRSGVVAEWLDELDEALAEMAAMSKAQVRR